MCKVRVEICSDDEWYDDVSHGIAGYDVSDPFDTEFTKYDILPTISHHQHYRCVAMPSPMGARRWVGQNCCHIFGRLWIKVNRIKFACAGVSVICNAFFWLTMSCYVPEIFAIKSRSCAKSRRNFDVLGPPNFAGGGRPPKFLTEFYKWVIEHVAKFGDDRPSDLGD